MTLAEARKRVEVRPYLGFTMPGKDNMWYVTWESTEKNVQIPGTKLLTNVHNEFPYDSYKAALTRRREIIRMMVEHPFRW